MPKVIMKFIQLATFVLVGGLPGFVVPTTCWSLKVRVVRALALGVNASIAAKAAAETNASFGIKCFLLIFIL
jgi:hypothetical protein